MIVVQQLIFFRFILVKRGKSNIDRNTYYCRFAFSSSRIQFLYVVLIDPNGVSNEGQTKVHWQWICKKLEYLQRKTQLTTGKILFPFNDHSIDCVSKKLKGRCLW